MNRYQKILHILPVYLGTYRSQGKQAERWLSLRFSTGDILDSLGFKGRIYTDSLKFAFPCAVMLYKQKPESLSIADYVVFTDSTGNYAFGNLPSGDFYLGAVRRLLPSGMRILS
jgi:hypothetical protein